jgi:hypothetical protein
MKPYTFYLSLLKGYGKVKIEETPSEAMPLDATDDGFRQVLAEKQNIKKMATHQQDYWTSVKKKILNGEISAFKPQPQPQTEAQWFYANQPLPAFPVFDPYAPVTPSFPPVIAPFLETYSITDVIDEVVPDEPTP